MKEQLHNLIDQSILTILLDMDRYLVVLQQLTLLLVHFRRGDHKKVEVDRREAGERREEVDRREEVELHVLHLRMRMYLMMNLLLIYNL